MTKNAAIRYAKEGIRVNSVHPGFVEPHGRAAKGTDMETHPGQHADGQDGPIRRRWPRSSPSWRDGPIYMTGSEVYADGGWTAR